MSSSTIEYLRLLVPNIERDNKFHWLNITELSQI